MWTFRGCLKGMPWPMGLVRPRSNPVEPMSGGLTGVPSSAGCHPLRPKPMACDRVTAANWNSLHQLDQQGDILVQSDGTRSIRGKPAGSSASVRTPVHGHHTCYTSQPCRPVLGHCNKNKPHRGCVEPSNQAGWTPIGLSFVSNL